MRELVLVGGGHSHAIVLRLLAQSPVVGARVTLISELPLSVYSGMLPGFIAGYYSLDEIQIDVAALASRANVNFIQAEVSGIDLSDKSVLCKNGSSVSFDVLSINVGSVTARDNTPGALEFSTPVKPVAELLQTMTELISSAASGQRVRIAVVGGGAGGVELVFALRERLGHLAMLHLVHNEREVLHTHNPRVRMIATSLLKQKGITSHLGMTVTHLEKGRVFGAGGECAESDFIFWATGASPPPWISASGLTLDNHGFISVTTTLQSSSHNFVFAAGDIASIEGHARPKSGVFAVRHGRPLWSNLVRYLENNTLVQYEPQSQFLSLIGTGNRAAIASRGEFAGHGKLMWWLKEKIDRRFMRQFTVD